MDRAGLWSFPPVSWPGCAQMLAFFLVSGVREVIRAFCCVPCDPQPGSLKGRRAMGRQQLARVDLEEHH